MHHLLGWSHTESLLTGGVAQRLSAPAFDAGLTVVHDFLNPVVWGFGFRKNDSFVPHCLRETFFPWRQLMAIRTRSRKDVGKFLIQKPSGQIGSRVQAVGPEHFGVLCFDCAKARSKFLFANFYGKPLIPPQIVSHTRRNSGRA